MNTTQTIKFRPAATSAMERANVPSVCGCCGREELKKTVKVVSMDGSTVLWMGTGCAAKACGMGVKEFGKSLKREQDAQDDSEIRARDAAAAARHLRWKAHLDAKCPQFAGDVFRQLEALGGMKIAREGFAG